MLTLSGVNKTFYPGTPNERRALVDVGLEMAEGDFVTIIGSNGAGKSTLLNVIAGSIPADQGSIRINDRDVTKLSEHRRAAAISRVFQDPSAGTSPHLTIEQNLAVALTRGQRHTLSRGLTRARRKQFREELATLEQGLENRMTHRVGLLSGGQRQALSLLMASFTKPTVLLLDEHTAALDPERAELVLRLTQNVIADHRLTALMVTHNMEHALRLGNRLVMMHEGRIIRTLDPESKASSQVSDLLDMFGDAKDSLSDRTLLSS
ncbi:MAG: ATP-binding cassette domain-containing protein [Cellulomonadaceae bacterium]|jgi:putative ABC transport system ATP-binding protein|nr:ATP-binding cassette domain-containing protein [Cellulomonadaceae bacterium]